MAKQPRLARDHTLSPEQWQQLDENFERDQQAAAAVEKAKESAPAEGEKSETSDGT